MTNEARIETSTVCNYNCKFCPHSEMTRPKKLMSIELYKEIIDKLPSNIEVLTLSGMGEMFLDPTIFWKIEYAKKKGYIVNALTNGSQFDAISSLALIKSGIDSIRISVHASHWNEYKNITGSVSRKDFEHVNNLINTLHRNKHDIEVIVTMDVTEDSMWDVDNIIAKYKDKVDLLEIWKVHNWAGAFDYRQGEKKKMTCGRPFNGPLQIQVDGTVNMCCFDYDGALTLGDLKKQTMLEIFSGDMYSDIVTFHNGGDLKKDILCKHCDQLYESDDSILIYNSRYGKERIGTLSTTYKELK